MKQINITIHPFSALGGMALLGLVLVTAGAMPLQGSSSTRDVSAISDINDPHPRDAVRFMNGSPYTVPSGKILLITCAMKPSSDSNHVLRVSINGVGLFQHGLHETGGGLITFPFGLTAAAGDIVEIENVTSNATGAVLLGYLADA